MDSKYIIALELSGSQVKGASAKLNKSDYVPVSIPVVENVVAQDAANCVQYGIVQNLIEAANNTNYVLQKLGNTPSLKEGTINGVYVGISGRSLSSIQAKVDRVLPSEMEITEDILKRLYQDAEKIAPADKKILAVLPRKFSVDNKASQNPVGTLGTQIRGEFTLVVCNPANKRNQELVLAERVHMPAKDFIITPLAIADMVLGEEEKQLGVALVDIGAQTTTVSIYKDRALQWIATLPLGSKNITRDIAEGLKITDERAEISKINQGDAKPPLGDNSEAGRINNYVQARAGEIIANIGAHLGTSDRAGFGGYKSTDLPGGIVLTGRGAKLRNFAEYLADITKMPVRMAQLPASIEVIDPSIDPNDYISLLAIIQAAASGNTQDCVSFSNIQIEQAAPESPAAYDPFDDNDQDNDLLIDDETAAVKRAKAEAEAEKRRRKAEEKAKKEEEERQRKEQKAIDKAERSANKRPLLDKIKNTVKNLFNDDGIDEDANLDEQ